MGKIPFSIKRKLKKICQCVSRGGRVLPEFNCHLSIMAGNSESKPMSRLIKWTKKIGSKVVAICCGSGHGYMRMDQEAGMKVPDGYMAVYVGLVEEDEFQRYLMPVEYVNHPLFRPLLELYEEKFGLHNPGPITIPCRISEFEQIQTQIKKSLINRKLLIWRKKKNPTGYASMI